MLSTLWPVRKDRDEYAVLAVEEKTKETPMPKMTGHRYFAEAMRGYGVTHLFYVNTIIPPAMDEIDKVGGMIVFT